MNKLHSLFSTIRARILAGAIFLVVLISIVVTLASYYIVSTNLQRNLIQTSETKISFLCSSIDSNIVNVKNFIRSCQISKKIINFAMEGKTEDNRLKREAHDFVTETYQANAALSTQLIRLVIIGNERPDIVQVVEAQNSTIAVSSDAIVSLPYFEQLCNNPEQVSTSILPDPFFTTKSLFMIPFVYPIQHPYEDTEIGYIFTEMSTAVITNPIHNYLSESQSLLYFRIDDRNYQYKNGTLSPCETSFTLLDDLSSYALNNDTSISRFRDETTHDTVFVISRPLDVEGWFVSECINTDELTREIIKTFLLITLIIILAASTIAVSLYWFLYKTVTEPVSQLQLRMKRIENGDFSRDSSTEWEHELGDIGKAINNLTENVQQMMHQRIEDEKQKKDYEYKMLQSQINPHFLYNTLNSIKWMATIQNAPGIAEMTTALSRLLKNIAKGTSIRISIEKELALVKDYFTIQQYRYGGTITMDIHADDEKLLFCEILNFTLQPLVENAIFHGIEPKGTAGKILIHIYQDEKTDVHIDVTDDGVGIAEDMIDRLLSENNTSSSFFKEIGLGNVHKRLRYEYGEKYGLSIFSTAGEYTTIAILLPFKKCEESV